MAAGVSRSRITALFPSVAREADLMEIAEQKRKSLFILVLYPVSCWFPEAQAFATKGLFF